jgi:hypothetical protein
MEEVKKASFLVEVGMRRLRVISTMLGLALAFFLVGAPAAFGDDFVCTRVVGAITVDNVVVPDGRTCTLNGTRVEGNVFVLTKATLSASDVRVDGNIQTEGARAVYVNPGSIVGGNIQIEQGGKAEIKQTRVDGDIQLFQNKGALLARGNRVGGNMQVFQNTGGVRLFNNKIAENLQCKENSPPPTGSGNIAGDKEDQCSRL